MLRKILVALSLLTSAAAVHAAEMEVTIKVPGYSEADATVAVEALRRNCRPLGDEFWEDVTKIQVTIEEETADYRTAHGWKNSMYLMLKYSDAPKFGPSYATGAGILAGHTLHFVLGGGWEPGIFVGKRSSQYLCGLSFKADGSDLFLPVPQLKFIDR